MAGDPLNKALSEFRDQCIFRINENPGRLENCLARISEDQLWQRLNNVTNSIGNLVLHLCGNARQYIISALGNQPDMRERDSEFNTEAGPQKKVLVATFNKTLEEVVDVIQSASEKDLLKTYSVQGFTMSGMAMVIHVTEHLSYHMGQIALLTKLLTGEDLGFYANIDLNQKNKHD
ncbi:MAG: DUF1572 family protein [Flavobacteriales bacterium]|nr:DUF1572 family protein [Flavobacteriales bacterium]